MSPHFCKKMQYKMLEKLSLCYRVNIQKTTKKLAIFIFEISLIIFLLTKWSLKNKINIGHPSVELEKVL